MSASASTSQERQRRLRGTLEGLDTLYAEGVSNIERMDKISTAVSIANTLLSEGELKDKANHPGEGYLDSCVLRKSSSLAMRSSELISGNVNEYNRRDLAEHIRDNPYFWEFPLPLEVPQCPYLYGTFASEPQEPKARAARAARAAQQPTRALRRPEDVNRLETTEQGSEMVHRVKNFIKRRNEPISYFHLVIDPDSFGRTIENIYNVSFLVKDGLISVYIDEEHGIPFVKLLNEEGKEADQRKRENQFIVSLDMQRWQELVNAFRIKKPMMVIKGRE